MNRSLGDVGCRRMEEGHAGPRTPIGCLRENRYIESFNGKMRDELLNREVFYTLEEAQVVIEGWRREYNHMRRESALGYRAPAAEAIQGLPIAAPLAGQLGVTLTKRLDQLSGNRSRFRDSTTRRNSR